jgi:hypothetical protein
MKELDSRVFKILEFLSKAEYGIKSDILPLMVEMFPIINVNDEQERNVKCPNVKLFYEKLISDKLIDARPDGLSSLGIGNFGNYNWLNHLQPINAYITEKGEEFLAREYQRLKVLGKDVLAKNPIKTPYTYIIRQYVTWVSIKFVKFWYWVLIGVVVFIISKKYFGG